MLFQIGIAKKKGGRTTLPYVYSEQGVAMLSSVLHSIKAVNMSIQIINAFVKMRHFIIDNKEYHNLKVIRNNSFHDRYFVIDKKEIYESGTSI